MFRNCTLDSGCPPRDAAKAWVHERPPPPGPCMLQPLLVLVPLKVACACHARSQDEFFLYFEMPAPDSSLLGASGEARCPLFPDPWQGEQSSGRL